MGTMNVIKRQSLSDGAVANLIDPRSGARLRPLGVRKDGRAIWPIMGGSGEEDSTGGGSTDTEDKDKDTGSESGDGSDASKDGEKDTSKDKGDPNAKIAALEEEKDRQFRRRTEAERERDQLKQRLQALEDKDKDDTTKAQEKLSSLEQERDTLAEALRDSRLENAFLKDNTYTWHNPGRALKLADLSNVEIDDDGTVHGLKEALDRLAKSDAYLLKQEEKREKEEDKPDTSSGGQKNKSKKDKTNGDDKRAELLKKYPALRR